jgi:hypothetical protein
VSGDRFAIVFHRFTAGAVPYLRIFDRGADPQTSDIALAGLGGTPAVAGNAGGFVVAFEQTDEVHAERFDLAGTSLGGDFRVNQYTTGNRGGPVIAVGPDGGFVVVWGGQGEGDTNGIFAARFDANGTRLVDDFLVNTYTTANQIKPSVAFSGGGDQAEFLIVWAGAGTGDADGIFARRYSAAGVPLTTPFRVNTTTSGATNYPAVAAHPEAPAFVVTWQESENAPANVFAQRYVKDGLVAGGEFQVNTVANTDHPAVAYEPNGKAFVIAYSGVRARRFLQTGAPTGAEFLVSTATTGTNSDPSVASFGPGTYVFAWTNSSRDGSGSGIYGQRFGPRGDVDGDGLIALSDVFYLINVLFAGGAAPL